MLLLLQQEEDSEKHPPCMFVSVCVCEREGGREREGEIESVCM